MQTPAEGNSTLQQGLKADLAAYAKRFGSDWRDGANVKVLASTLFLFFACVAPAVAFGGLMSTMTGGAIGIVEMMLGTALCGVVWALFSGQPLIILGGTGPLLVFTGVLATLCQQLDLPFLPTYAWVGAWTGLFTIVLAVTGASKLVRYFTRFTDETFAVLISIIFIVEALKALRGAFHDNRVSDTAEVVSLLLALGTFTIARQLKTVRSGPYLRRWAREFLADFGPAIAMGSMAIVGWLLGDATLPALNVPDTVTTTSGRPWLVDVFALPGWAMAATVVPAALATILVFMDQNITARLVNNPVHALTKGDGYHQDLALVGVLTAVTSVFGLPWLVAATVRSLNHVTSLASYGSAGPGGAPRITGVVETRLSGFAIHLAVGASLLALPLLKLVPMAILHGLFLYMGVTSLLGNQFFDRLRLWVLDPTLHPSIPWAQTVPTRRIHAFTVFQSAALAMLWVVKASVLGIFFPLAIALLVPLRGLAGRLIGEHYVAPLDQEETPEEETSNEIE